MIIIDKFCLFCIKTDVVTSHLNCLAETVQMNVSDEGSQHMVTMRNKKNYHQVLPLI